MEPILPVVDGAVVDVAVSREASDLQALVDTSHRLDRVRDDGGEHAPCVVHIHITSLTCGAMQRLGPDKTDTASRSDHPIEASPTAARCGTSTTLTRHLQRPEHHPRRRSVPSRDLGGRKPHSLLTPLPISARRILNLHELSSSQLSTPRNQRHQAEIGAEER